MKISAHLLCLQPCKITHTNELLINGADFTQNDFNGDKALSLAMQNDSKQDQRVLENPILAMLKGLVTSKGTID